MPITREHIREAREKFDPNSEEPYAAYFVPEGDSDLPIRAVDDMPEWVVGTRGLISIPPLILQLQLITYEDEEDEEDFSWEVIQTVGELSDEPDAETLYLVYMPTKKGDEWEKVPKEMKLEDAEKLMETWGFD